LANFENSNKFNSWFKNEITITQTQTTCIKTEQNQKPFSLSKLTPKKKHNDKLQNPTNHMYWQARLSVMASIWSYRTLCILLQEHLYMNPIHPAPLHQIQDLLYATHYYDTVLPNFRRSRSFLSPDIIGVQPPFPGRNHEQQPARKPRTTPLAIPSFLRRKRKKETRKKKKNLQCYIVLKIFLW